MQIANGQVANGQTSWDERVKAYREEHGMSRKQFAEASGLPAHTVGVVEKGGNLKHHHQKKLQAFFVNLQHKVQEEEIPLDQYGLDPTSQKLMEKIIGLADQHKRLAGVVGFAFRHMEENEGAEIAHAVATSFMRKYLASIADHEERLNKLLELHDIVRDAPRTK